MFENVRLNKFIWTELKTWIFFALFNIFYDLKVCKKLISTSKRRAEHLFAGWNTQQSNIHPFARHPFATKFWMELIWFNFLGNCDLFQSKNYVQGRYRKKVPKSRNKLPPTSVQPKGPKNPNNLVFHYFSHLVLI